VLVKNSILIGFLTGMSVVGLAAQQINFGLFAGQDITLTAVTDELDFNTKQPLIVPGSNDVVTIDYLTDQPAVLTIAGQADLDVTVTLTVPTHLELNGGEETDKIPVSFQFAYSNKGSVDLASAKTAAIPVTSGIYSATFQIKQRATGTRAVPPTPRHGGYTPPTATAYLFIYGALGPVGVVGSGLYEGTINVSVEYSSYD